MPKTYVAAVLLCLVSTLASAGTLTDPVGDFVPSYDGAKNPDLDVTSFSVNFALSANHFLLNPVFAGTISSSDPGFYVVGVDTGTPTLTFAVLGFPGVSFTRSL